jgi:spermidine synthase
LPQIRPEGAERRRDWPQIYLAVSLTTLATLILELTLTRIFSVVFYYHFAFLAISIALFGLGAGGVLSYVFTPRDYSVFQRLGQLSCLASVCGVLSTWFVLSRGEPGTLTLILIYFVSALPFVFTGAIVSMAISETIERVSRVYFFDLMGAAAGCLVLIPMLNIFGGPNSVIAGCILLAVSAAIWFNLAGSIRARAAAVALSLALVALIALNWRHTLLDVHFAKGQAIQNERFVEWNSFSRIGLQMVPGEMPLIVIDADASTGIMTFDLNKLTPEQARDLESQGPGFPYQVRPGGKTLIIGPGGGWDVARALHSGSKDVTGVEINPIIARRIMQERFPELSHNLYKRPEVRIMVEDGRSFVRRSTEKYDVIQATLVDTWASTAAGAFALSENNLYTTDAFYDYLSHLTPKGILAFTRWGFDPPRESLRLLTLAREALSRLGETDYARHVMVIREGGAKELAGWGARDTVLISRKPFEQADVDRAMKALEASNGAMQAVYMPGVPGQTPFHEVLQTPDLAGFYTYYHYDVTPVSDNRPFFFYTVQPNDLLQFFLNREESADYKINRAVPMLFGLMGVSLLATLITLLLPPLVLGSRLPTERGVRTFLLYFLCLGAGYILVQVALIQKFVILLGHPTYALTVIVFSMLVSSGLGSYYSGKVTRDDEGRLGGVLALVALLVFVLAMLAPILTDAAISWPLPAKVLLTILAIAPAGFFMGMPFPLGLARLERWHKPSVRWAWALNAASSVLGSASAIFIAIYFGLQASLLFGGLLYLVAMVVLRATRRAVAQETVTVHG